jgi:DNA-binding XRE family transcriptional regulator
VNPVATKWRDIRKTLSPEAEERTRQSVREAAGVMTLYQLREARSLTQVNLAKVLNINQGAVSKMEKRTDMGNSRSKPSFPRVRYRSTNLKLWPIPGMLLFKQFEMRGRLLFFPFLAACNARSLQPKWYFDGILLE